MQFSEIRLGDGQYLTQRRRRLSSRWVVWRVVLQILDGESIEFVQTWEKEVDGVPV